MKSKKVVVSTYRYIWKNKEGKLNVKYVTETEEGHVKFKQMLQDNEDILSAMCEYVQEVDITKIGLTDTFKTEVKKDEESID